ncbi:MAG: VWA domain-containing protein [Chlorobi bacterium]|nr:VWA domain-containing protein [Chlorobiota bacterium]
MKIQFKIIILSIILLVNTNYFFGQELKKTKVKTRILFVLDASQSMLSQWESGRKIDVARNMLIQMVDSLKQVSTVEMALRVYGHQKPVPPQDCDDTKLEVPFEPGNAAKIKHKLKQIIPKGTTPIAYALEMSSKDFPDCDNCRNIIVLITDGIEACDGDPCAVSKALQKQGIILKPFVVGIGLDDGFKKTFECVGHYFDATNETKFKEVMEVVISQALNSTTAQVNLLDEYYKPTETDVTLTFYDNFSGIVKHNYIQTINHRGNPDTINLDPLLTYDLVVQTIPPVRKDSIVLTPGKHNIIAVDVPQGTLLMKKPNGNQYKDLQFIIRKKGNSETLNIQKVGEEKKYITGLYEIEVLTLPRLQIPDVEIKQSYTTTVEIPQPGIVTLFLSAPGYGALFVEKDNKLERVYNLNPNKMQESIVLQPGNYTVVFRSRNSKEIIYSIQRKFRINSGSSIPVKLY